jgi:hypothetical protein
MDEGWVEGGMDEGWVEGGMDEGWHFDEHFDGHCDGHFDGHYDHVESMLGLRDREQGHSEMDVLTVSVSQSTTRFWTPFGAKSATLTAGPVAERPSAATGRSAI